MSNSTSDAPERVYIGRASLDIASRTGSGDFYLKRTEGLIDIEYQRVHQQSETGELRECPWCKTSPEVCKAAGYGFTVECVNETCPVAPSLNVTRGRQNAIRAWNARVHVPVDDERVRAIRKSQKKRREDLERWGSQYTVGTVTLDDIDYLLTLLYNKRKP